MPKFDLLAIAAMILVMLIIAVESTGSVFAVGDIVGKRIGQEDIAKTVRADGVSSVIGGTFNSFPYTCFSENVGLVRLTGVKSRWIVAAAGVMMIILGLLPKSAAAVAAIPAPVLGGAALGLFATVAVVGIQVLGKVDFTDSRNLMVVSTALAAGMFVTTYPDVSRAVPEWLEIPFGSGITLGSIVAIVMKLLFFHVGKPEGPSLSPRPGGKPVALEEVNTMSREAFAETFSTLAQGSDWVLDRAYQGIPFADTSAVRAAFTDAVLSGTREEQLELLTSFPDLADTDDDGSQLAVDHVALAALSKDDYADVVQLAGSYREQFGFPLVVCARETAHFDKVLSTGWERMENSAATEQAMAMVEITKIINYRFDEAVADANPIATALTGYGKR